MLFLRQDSSSGPSAVDRIFFGFFLGAWGGVGAYLTFLASRGGGGGANSKGSAYLKEGANSSIYGGTSNQLLFVTLALRCRSSKNIYRKSSIKPPLSNRHSVSNKPPF